MSEEVSRAQAAARELEARLSDADARRADGRGEARLREHVKELQHANAR